MNSIDYELIGLRIRDKRKEEHYTQEQLAWKSNLSSTYISYVETGKKRVSLKALIAIANALETTFDELLTDIQLSDTTIFNSGLNNLLGSCSISEKRFIYEIVRAVVGIFRRNNITIHISQED